MSFCTYGHFRADTGTIFYVGKGSLRDSRHAKLRGRNVVWQRVVAKHGVKVEVLARWETEAEAFEHERLLISVFRALGVTLANLTDGGDGVSGWRASPETRRKLSEAQKGRKRPLEAVEKTAAALRGRKRPKDVVQRVVQANAGYRHTEETKAKIRAARAAQTVSDAQKQRVSEKLKGRKKSPEHIAKAREAYVAVMSSIDRAAAARKAWETKRRKASEALHA